MLYKFPVFAAVVLTFAQSLCAQQARPLTVRIMAVDSMTGQALVRTTVWELRRIPNGGYSTRAGQADSNGVMQLDSVIVWPVQVNCAGLKRFQGSKLFDLDSLCVVRASPTDTIKVSVDGTRCDRRPLVPEYGEWVGHYVPGFESSSLSLCSAPERKIWVDYAKDFYTKPRPKWPKGNDPYYPRYFVNFRGRLIGPYSYGHLGASDYLLTVDSLVFVRSPSKRDCKPKEKGRHP